MRDLGLLTYRLSFGLTMLFAHGIPKLANYSTINSSFPDPLGLGSGLSLILAIFSEVFCAAALALGLATRWVSLPLLITMLVALFLVHGGDPFGKQEKALLYALAYLGLFFTGGGIYSLDFVIFKKKTS